ncbi:MAG: amidohydrolase family protein, partial [Micromonosporaceae bacterium]
MPTLYRGGRVYCPADPHASAMLVEDDRIAWLGPDDERPDVADVVDLDGGLVTPAFVDAHVHVTDTGLALLGLDLSGAASVEEALDRVAAHAATLPTDATVIGHGWDESGWSERRAPTASELDRAAAGRKVYLARVDVH